MIHSNMEKKGQQVFGMSFATIFSIILIIFILGAALIAIRHFIGLKNCAQINIFIEDFQKDVDKAWNSQKSSFEFEGEVPGGLKYLCFANLTKNLGGNDIEDEIADDILLYEGTGANLFFYPTEESCEYPYYNIKHLDIESITKLRNPYCIKIENGRPVIKIEKGFNQNLVKVS